jgi:hypothetical protein
MVNTFQQTRSTRLRLAHRMDADMNQRKAPPILAGLVVVLCLQRAPPSDGDVLRASGSYFCTPEKLLVRITSLMSNFILKLSFSVFSTMSPRVIESTAVSSLDKANLSK